jgi:hypothetical protein
MIFDPTAAPMTLDQTAPAPFDPTAQWVPALRLGQLATTVDRQIKRIGVQAVWRSDAGDRWCWAYFAEWNPREMMARLIEPMDRRVLVSAISLPIQPQFRVERLVTFVQPFNEASPVEWEELQLFEAPRRLNPNGVVLCWDCRCRQ